MCPLCLATAAVIAGKATSTGGLAAFVIRKFYPKRPRTKLYTQNKSKENHNGQ
jgi:hypothetical protein